MYSWMSLKPSAIVTAARRIKAAQQAQSKPSDDGRPESKSETPRG